MQKQEFPPELLLITKVQAIVIYMGLTLSNTIMGISESKNSNLLDNAPPQPPPAPLKKFINSGVEAEKFEPEQEVALFAKFYKSVEPNFWICKILHVHRYSRKKNDDDNNNSSSSADGAADTTSSSDQNKNSTKKPLQQHEKKNIPAADDVGDLEVSCIPGCTPKCDFDKVPNKIKSIWLLRDYGSLYQITKATPKDVKKKFEDCISDKELKKLWMGNSIMSNGKTKKKNASSEQQQADEKMKVPQGLLENGFDKGPMEADLNFLRSQEEWNEARENFVEMNGNTDEAKKMFQELDNEYGNNKASENRWTHRSSTEFMMYSLFVSEFQTTRALKFLDRQDKAFERRGEDLAKKYS